MHVAMQQRLRPFICPFDVLIECVPPGSRLLDIGCGAGLFIGLLALQGRIQSAMGVDPSSMAIRSARSMQLPEALKARIEFRQGGASEVGESGGFDVVSMIDLFHHLGPSERVTALENACRALEPGGFLLYKDMAARPRWRAAANTIHDLLLARQWVNHVPVEEVVAMAGRHGLSPHDRGRINLLWYAHEYVVFRKGNAAPPERQGNSLTERHP